MYKALRYAFPAGLLMWALLFWALFNGLALADDHITVLVNKAHPVCAHNIVHYVHLYPKQVAYVCNMVGDIELAELIYGSLDYYQGAGND